MKKTNAGKLTVFAAAALSVAMLLGACGGASTANNNNNAAGNKAGICLLYTSPSPRDS